MSRPIDADAVLNRYYAEFEKQDICDGSQDRDWLIQCIEEAPTLTPPNEALTIEQLREMNKKPVWVQDLKKPEESQWGLLYWDRGKYLVLQGISVRGYLLEEYGESWLAYRRPPEGEKL